MARDSTSRSGGGGGGGEIVDGESEEFWGPDSAERFEDGEGGDGEGVPSSMDPSIVTVPGGYAWQDFLRRMRWTVAMLNEQPDDMVHLHWVSYQLECRFGELSD